MNFTALWSIYHFYESCQVLTLNNKTMPYAKTPELEKLRRERIRQSKIGKKRAPFKMPEVWKEKLSLRMKRFWKTLPPQQRTIKLKELAKNARKGHLAVMKKAGTLRLSPQERERHHEQKREEYRKKNWQKVYALNRKWVANNLERRREIARLSARRRRLAKQQSVQP